MSLVIIFGISLALLFNDLNNFDVNDIIKHEMQIVKLSNDKEIINNETNK